MQSAPESCHVLANSWFAWFTHNCPICKCNPLNQGHHNIDGRFSLKTKHVMHKREQLPCSNLVIREDFHVWKLETGIYGFDCSLCVMDHG